MRIQEAVRSTLVGAAVSMNLTHGHHKSVQFDQDRISEDGRASTATHLTVLRSQDSMAVHRARLARHRDSDDSCRVQVESDEEEASCLDDSCADSAPDEQGTAMGSVAHVQWDDQTASVSDTTTHEGEQSSADQVGHKKDSYTRAEPPGELPEPPGSGETGLKQGPGEPSLTALSLLVQREDSLSLAHRRMSAHDSPRSRHSTGEISKGDHRRSRFHFAPADLLSTDAFQQVTGSIKAFYQRSMSLGIPQSPRSSSAERRSSFRHSPVRALRSSLKRATSERLPAKAEPMCPEAGQAVREWSPARHPNRSSLKTSLSRQSSMQACGLEMEPLQSRRVSVHFE